MTKTHLVNLKNEIFDTITTVMLNLQELHAKYDIAIDDMIDTLERKPKKTYNKAVKTEKTYGRGLIRNPYGRGGNDVSSIRADAMKIIGFKRTTKFNEIKHIAKYRKAYWRAVGYLLGRTPNCPEKVR
jgi:hypothetical protein